MPKDETTTVTFETLKIRRLSEVIESYIKDLIVNKKVLPGQRLPTEKEISRQFGVSVVTVREALRGLESFGFIEKKKGKGGGIFVTRASGNPVLSTLRTFLISREFSVKHLAEVRHILEPANARMAVQRITESELKAIKKNLDFYENKLRRMKTQFDAKDYYEISDGNAEFHRLIAEAARNPLLILIVDYAMDFLTGLYHRNSFTPSLDNARLLIMNHHEIYKLLQARDADGLETLLREHIDKEQGLIEKFDNKLHSS